MHIHLKPVIGFCTDYIDETSGIPSKVTIVIAPVSIKIRDGKIKVIWSCNMWRKCMNKACTYSRVNRREVSVQQESNM